MNRDSNVLDYKDELSVPTQVHLEAIIHSISDGLFMLDKENNFSFLNQGGKDFFYQPETIAKNGDSFNHTHYYDMQGMELSVEDMIGSRVLRGEIVKQCRIKAVRPDKTIYYSFSGNPVYDNKGEVLSAVLCCRDITEQIESDLLIFRRKEQLEALFENISDGIFISDKEGKFLFANSEGKRQLYQPDSINALRENHSRVQYFDMEGNGVTLDNMPGIRALRGEKIKNEWLQVKGPDKEIFIEANAIPIYDGEGNLYMVAVCTHDITDLVEKENEIKRQKEQMEAVLENMFDALLIFDKDDNCILLNKSARNNYVHLKGQPEKLGDGFKRVEFYDVEGNLIPLHDSPVQRVKRGEKLIAYQMRIATGDINIYTEGNGTPIYDREGNFYAGVLCSHDITEKVSMEKTLKDSEAKYKDLYNNMLMGHSYYQIITNESGKPIDYIITELNPAYEIITGLKRSEIIGRRASELFPGIENSSVDWIGIIGEVALTGKIISKEVYSDIVDRWFNVYYYCPQYGYTACIFSDITDRINNEKELNITKKKLQEAQEFAHLGYWEFDVKNGELSWSDELFRIFGFKRQEFIPTTKDLMNIIHPDDREFMVNNTMQQVSKGSVSGYDFRIIRRDNTTIWVHEKIKYEYNTSAKLVRVHGIDQDITQRKLSELKLKESEEKFRELAENLGQVIWVRQDEKLVYISPAYEKVWGRTCQSLYEAPQSFMDSIHPEDKEIIMKAYLAENNAPEYLFDERYRIIIPDGKIRWIWSRTFPIFNEIGKIIRRVGISDDITRIKEYEEQTLKNEMVKEMARLDKLSLVGEMAAGIGHEVRNPMTTVRGYLQLLGNKEEFSKFNSQFELMIDELDRANSIITEFLSLAKNRVVEYKVQSLNEIVKNIYPLIQADGLITDKYIHMELEEVLEIPLDNKEINQLIFNLVLNGAQAMSSGGTLEIRTFMDNEEIVLSVHDEGKGIAPEVLEKIGTPFFTTKDNGTGLGLAVCYSIVARHNAKIDIETGSTGTTFFVRFKKQ